MIARQRVRYGTVMSGALRPWAPQQLPTWMTPTLSVVVACAGLVRGADLVRSPTSTAEINLWVSQIGQLEWGIALVAASLAVILSMLVPLARRNWVVLAAHAFIAGTYVSYAASLTGGWLEAGAGPGARFPLTTAVAAVLWVLLTLVHISLVVRTLAADPLTGLPPAAERRHHARRRDDRSTAT
ncbi:hypothetical protein WDZ16_12875 [Pseudokineococcus marinus]|uniref:Uncharacterized protein n=1 Tax=Pseudokineococcus marinus TaxID=351215 RepID=A0A849BVP5_9ACTN|nr:hypothetical protein [Pseudokineococcus marinus]NNH21628.1 hypothetical protein [Pseudokineococcus marinus]